MLENSSNILLSVNSVSKIYKKNIYALKPLSFLLYKKTILGIIGESGAGKSTLAKLIQGLETVSSGKLLYYSNNDIIDLTKLNRFERSKIVQTIFQNPTDSLNPKHTIAYSLDEVLYLHKTTHSQLNSILDKLELSSSLLKKYPHELSGGQNQRIAIARALIPKPKILIADEATASLDPSVRASILNLLQKLQQKDELSIIFISHDIRTIQTLAHNIMVLKDGKLVEQGTKDSIIRTPKTKYTKSLLEAIPSPAHKEKYLKH